MSQDSSDLTPEQKALVFTIAAIDAILTAIRYQISILKTTEDENVVRALLKALKEQNEILESVSTSHKPTVEPKFSTKAVPEGKPAASQSKYASQYAKSKQTIRISAAESNQFGEDVSAFKQKQTIASSSYGPTHGELKSPGLRPSVEFKIPHKIAAKTSSLSSYASQYQQMKLSAKTKSSVVRQSVARASQSTSERIPRYFITGEIPQQIPNISGTAANSGDKVFQYFQKNLVENPFPELRLPRDNKYTEDDSKIIFSEKEHEKNIPEELREVWTLFVIRPEEMGKKGNFEVAILNGMSERGILTNSIPITLFQWLRWIHMIESENTAFISAALMDCWRIRRDLFKLKYVKNAMKDTIHDLYYSIMGRKEDFPILTEFFLKFTKNTLNDRNLFSKREVKAIKDEWNSYQWDPLFPLFGEKEEEEEEEEEED